MSAFFMPVIVFFTVIASVSFGIFTAYLAVTGILLTFGRSPQPAPVPARPRLVLVPTQSHASGD